MTPEEARRILESLDSAKDLHKRLKELEKKVDVVLACQEMSRQLAEMRISMLPK
jgi:tetrahydromethanopterin S-methyltransferase subunit G